MRRRPTDPDDPGQAPPPRACARRQPGLRAFAVAAALAALPGASALEATPAVFPTPAEQAASFAPYDAHRIGGIPASRWMAQRQVLLLTGAERTARGGVAGGGGHACAAPLSADGYLLTVTHSLREPVLALRLRDDGSTEALPARVVWRGSDDGCDAALLHVPWKDAAPCEWADAGAIAAGDALLSAGATMVQGAERQWLERERAAGRAGGPPEAALARAGEPAYAWLHARLPASPGDSGGPVMTLDGRLVGVMAAHLLDRDGNSTGWSLVIRPDPAFLEQTIASDRLRPRVPVATLATAVAP